MNEYTISLFNDETLKIETAQIIAATAEEALKSIKEKELKNNSSLSFVMVNSFPLCVRLNKDGTSQRIYR